MKTGERRQIDHMKGTGFHPHDPDYTRGRGREMARADYQARMDIGLARRVWLQEEKEAPK